MTLELFTELSVSCRGSQAAILLEPIALQCMQDAARDTSFPMRQPKRPARR